MINNNKQYSYVTANQQTWLLATPSEKTPLATFYKEGNNPKISWLYETTPLDDVKKQGPLLINITNTALPTDFNEKPEEWTAFLLHTSNNTTQEQLLKHLRNLLIVSLNEEEIGVLNYCDPKVASFFFKMPESQLAQWLGPIDHITWSGGDFIARENNQPIRYTINNPQPPDQRALLQEKPMLTHEQQQLLQTCQEQQYLWQWSNNVNIPFLNAWQHYQEGMQLGFTEDDLENYIKLRAQHAAKALPEHYPPNMTAQQKLQLLKEHWITESV